MDYEEDREDDYELDEDDEEEKKLGDSLAFTVTMDEKQINSDPKD